MEAGDAAGPPGRPRGGRRHVHARRRRWPRRLVATVALACIVAGVGIGVQIYRYHLHSDRVGGALVRREQQALSSAGRTRSCTPPGGGTAGPAGAAGGTVSVPGDGLAATPTGVPSAGEPTVYALLRAPTIGLVAPVVDGTGEAELSVAVGHVAASSWPGPSGTSVLEAHDVTWFSRLDHLRPGDVLTVETPCRTFTYRVGASQVVTAGTPVLQTTESRLVLVTCYPLDALSLTTQRLVVTAGLAGVADRGGAPGGVSAPSAPTVPAPAPLAAQGLDLAHNPAPMGTLAVTGTPTSTWQQSAAPLDDEGAVIALYFAALRSAEQDQPAWWAAVAPSVPVGAAHPLAGATVAHNDSTFDPVLAVTGATLTGATLTTVPVLAGGPAPGLYRITMTATATAGQLVVTGWTMAPV